jgi:hypothetical protein
LFSYKFGLARDGLCCSLIKESPLFWLGRHWSFASPAVQGSERCRRRGRALPPRLTTAYRIPGHQPSAKLLSAERRPSAGGIGGRHGMPQQRRTQVADLKNTGEHHDSQYRLRQSQVICKRNHGQKSRSKENDWQQNQDPETNSQG